MIFELDAFYIANRDSFDVGSVCSYDYLSKFNIASCVNGLDSLEFEKLSSYLIWCDNSNQNVSGSFDTSSLLTKYYSSRRTGIELFDLVSQLEEQKDVYWDMRQEDRLAYLMFEMNYNYEKMYEANQMIVVDYILFLVHSQHLLDSYPSVVFSFLNSIAIKSIQCEVVIRPEEVLSQYQFINNKMEDFELQNFSMNRVNSCAVLGMIDPDLAVIAMNELLCEIDLFSVDVQLYYYQLFLELLVSQDCLNLKQISTIQKRLDSIHPVEINENVVSDWINRVDIELTLDNYQKAEYYINKIEQEYDGELGFILSSYIQLHRGRISLWKSKNNGNSSELKTALNHFLAFYTGISSKVGKSNTLHYADWHKESLLYLVNIYLELYQATKEEKWLDEANASFSKCKYIITQTQLLQGERMHQWPVEVQRQLDDINVQLDQLEGMDKILSPLNEERYKIYKKHVVYEKREEEVDTINYLAAELEEEGFHLSDSTLQIVEYLTDASYNFVRVFNADTQYIERIDFSDKMNTKLNHTIRAIQENKEILYSKVLYDSIVSPYLSPDYPKVVFIPDGQLSSLPFEALVTELDTNSVPTYLIDDYEVSYTYHLSALKEEEETYPLDDIGMFSLTDNITMRDRRKKIMPELHGGWAEVQQCADLASNYNIVRYQGYEANEAALEDVLSRDIAHFATHAASNPDNRLDNYLYVRQDEKMVRYYGYNIPTLDIDTKLAILSACETGTGAYTRGEGVHSISRYLIGEGVPSVMKTLWKVNDNNSGLLLSQFYKAILDGNDLSSAINSAKHKVKELPEYSHPYYWAGYVLDGNPYLRFDLENQ